MFSIRPACSGLSIVDALDQSLDFNSREDFEKWFKNDVYSKYYKLNTMKVKFHCTDNREICKNYKNTYLVTMDTPNYKDCAVFFANKPLNEW